MNPVERDIRGYFGIAPEDSILEHYGTKRHSGRYPWGSGENPYQRSGDFLSRVEELKKSGMKEKDILQTINDSLPEEYKMGATEFRMAQRRAIHERQQLKYDRARALSQDGLGPTEIGREMGLSESTVRSMLKNDKPDKYTRTKEIAETLRKEVDKKGMIAHCPTIQTLTTRIWTMLTYICATIRSYEYNSVVPCASPNAKYHCAAPCSPVAR